MKPNDWNTLKQQWKKQEKPIMHYDWVEREYLRRKKRAVFGYILELLILAAVIGYTVFSIIADQVRTIIIVDLWITLLIIGVFIAYNRISFSSIESNSTHDYLLFLRNHSIRKKKSGLFVITYTVLHTLFFFFQEYFNSINEPTILFFSISICYVAWGTWYYIKSKREEAEMHRKYVEYLDEKSESTLS